MTSTLTRLVILAGVLGPLAGGLAAQVRTLVVPLQAPIGTPLRLYLTQRIWFRPGAPVTAKVIEPVWAFDRIVIPAGTTVQGTVTALPKVSRWERARAIAGGDFTPLKRAELGFTSMALPDGRQIAITAAPAEGLNTIYIPKKQTAAAQTSQANWKAKLKQQMRQQYETRRDAAIYWVRGQNKKEWVEEFLLAKLPYHPQWYRARTRVDAVLTKPLPLGEATVRLDGSKGFGQLPPEQQEAQVRLLTTLTSSEARVGEPVAGVLTKPIFAKDQTLLVPEGTAFSGKVMMAERARWFHRGGKLRWTFNQMDLPTLAGQQPEERAATLPPTTSQPILTQLSGIETNPQAVTVDSEGTTKATESKTRLLRPVVAGLLAAHSADNDADRIRSGGGVNGVSTNPNWNGRALGGFSGLGLLGTAASFGPRAIGASLGYYGFAWSVYTNVIARGRELTFEKNTAMEIRLGPDKRRK